MSQATATATATGGPPPLECLDCGARTGLAVLELATLTFEPLCPRCIVARYSVAGAHVHELGGAA